MTEASHDHLPAPHRLRRMLGRDPREHKRSVTPLELLFDLTFVVAFAQAGDQVAHFVAEGHIATAVWGFAFVLFSVAWAWISFTWFSSAFDTDDWLQRAFTMVQMVGVVILALGIPQVFESIDQGESFNYRVVAAGYVVMRSAMIAMWVRAAIQDPANRRAATRYAWTNGVIQVAWVAVALMPLDDVVLVTSLLVALWVLELVGPVVSTWQGRGAPWQGTPWNAHHIVERFGLLVLITLGEGILGTIAAVAAVVEHVGWSADAVVVVIAGVGITFGLWWTYFIVPAAPVLQRHRARCWSWGYWHILMFGAVAAVGAGLHVAAYAAEGEATIGTVGVVLAVVIPLLIFTVVYFVLYSILFRAVDPFHLWLAAGMVVFQLLGVALAFGGVPLSWCLLVVTLSPYVVVVGYETGGYRHVAADVAREG